MIFPFEKRAQCNCSHGCGLTEFVLSSFHGAFGYRGTRSPFSKYWGLRAVGALAQVLGKGFIFKLPALWGNKRGNLG